MTRLKLPGGRWPTLAAALTLAPALLLGGAAGGGAGGPSPTRLLGGPLNPADRPAQLTAATSDPTGAPVIAWIQRDPQAGAATPQIDHLRAARWDGRAWQPLGAVVNEDLRHNASRLTTQQGPDGQPWLSWAEDAGTAHVDSVLISGWDGRRWSEPGRYALRRNLSDAGKSSAFAVRPDGTPFVVWTNIYYPGAFANVVQPFRWLGSRWDQSARPLNSLKRAAFFPAAGAARDGTLFAVWLEGDVARSAVRVARQRPGGAWTPLGGALNTRPETYTFAPRLQLDRQGLPVVAWLEDQGGIDNAFVKRWDGARWVRLGRSLNLDPRQPADRPALALDAQGHAVVTWAEGPDGAQRVYARRWTGRAWLTLGGGPLNLDPRANASTPSVMVDRQDRAVVAWREGDDRKARVYVKRFELR